ncbi:hypothetical protein ACG0Z6_12735 [Roseateles sp. BYS180W]|uniref:Uncharacterized protein n=1 Tax=Roseateles rivi TaxID=3299028 RepID=A0ABW7FXR0_9BURK
MAASIPVIVSVDHTSPASPIEPGPPRTEPISQSIGQEDVATVAKMTVPLLSTPGHTLPSATLRSLGESAPEILFAAYTRGRNSSLPLEKYAAYYVASFCAPVVLGSDSSATMRASESWGQNILLATNSLRERCRLFASIPSRELTAQVRRLQDEVIDARFELSPVLVELLRDETDADEIRRTRRALKETFERYGADALQWAGPGLAIWIDFAATDTNWKSSLDPLLHDADLAAILPVAMCFSGFKCGPDGILYLRLCSTAARCGRSVDSDVLNRLSSVERRDKVEQQAKFIARVLETKEFGRLGL